MTAGGLLRRAKSFRVPLGQVFDAVVKCGKTFQGHDGKSCCSFYERAV